MKTPNKVASTNADSVFAPPVLTPFVTVWKFTSARRDYCKSISFFTKGSFTIDWGDGSPVEEIKGHVNSYKQLKHLYGAGEYTVTMHNTGPYTDSAGDVGTGGICGFSMNPEMALLQPIDVCNSADALIEIKQWGNSQWERMEKMFDGARNMVCSATDTPDTSKVKTMAFMFYGCSKFNSPIEHWDVSAVKDMTDMFWKAVTFNQSLAKMDVRNVQSVGRMLEDTPAFDQDLRDFKTSSKVNTDALFGNNKSLAQYNEKYGAKEDKHKFNEALNTGPAQ